MGFMTVTKIAPSPHSLNQSVGTNNNHLVIGNTCLFHLFYNLRLLSNEYCLKNLTDCLFYLRCVIQEYLDLGKIQILQFNGKEKKKVEITLRNIKYV